MRRAVAGAIALALGLLLLGGLLDSAVNRDAVGRSVDGRADPTLEDLALGRYEPLLVLAATAPHARFVLDADGPELLRPVEVLAFADARSVETRSLAGLELPDGPPNRSGDYRRGRWTLTVAEGSIDTLVVTGDRHTARIVDARLVGGPAAAALTPDPGPGAGSAAPPRLAERATGRRVVAIESGLLLLLLLLGGMLLRRDVGGPGVRLPIAFVVGVALIAATGILRLPGLWSLAPAALATVAVTSVARRTGAAFGWRVADLPALSVAAALTVATVHEIRARGLVTVTGDSFAYLAGGRLLADGRLSLDLLELKRGLGQQAVHALGFALGTDGLLALGPVLLVAVMVLLIRTTSAFAVPVLVVATFLAAPQILTMAVYVNSHLLVAALLLAAVVLLGLADGQERDDPATATAVAVLLVAVVLLRAEGTLLAGLLLLGTLAARWRAPSTAWWGLGSATVVWNGLLLAGAARRGEDPATLVVVLVLLGTALLLVPTALSKVPVRTVRALPAAAGAGLWLVAVVLLFGRVGDVRFLDAVATNLGEGAGGWGTAGPALAALAVLAVGLGPRQGDGRGLHAARWVLVGAVPLALLTKLGDGLDDSEAGLELLLTGGGRVGWGDSVNRMWMHVVLLIALLVLHRIRADDPLGVRGWRIVRTAVVVPIAVWVAVIWQPQFVGDGRDAATVEVRRQLLDVQAGELIGELVAGARLTQEILVSPVDDPPASATRVRVCVRPLFVTFGRELTGAMDIEVRTVAATVRTRIDVADIEDLADGRACILLPEDAQALTGLTVVLSSPDDGTGSPEGSGVGLISGVGGGLQPPGRFATPLRAGREVTEDGPLAMRVDVRYFVPREDPLLAAMVRVSDTATPWAPRVVAGIVTFLLLLDLRRSPVDGAAVRA